MRAFLALLITGILLSIVGASGEGLLWLSVLGMLTVLGAAAYAALSSRPPERQRDEPVQRQPQHEPWRRRRTATLTCQSVLAVGSDSPAVHRPAVGALRALGLTSPLVRSSEPAGRASMAG
jgi:hypothetical protein